MAAKKEGTKETAIKPETKQDEDVNRSTMIDRNARTIDVITMMNEWKYMPSVRIANWNTLLQKEELEFLKDLMNISMTSLKTLQSRFSVKLYDVLYKIKAAISQVRIEILTELKDINGNLPVTDLEGYYIDCGYKQNGNKTFVKVGPGPINNKRRVIYIIKDGRWAFHDVNGANNNWAWMASKQKAANSVISNDLDYTYWNDKEKKSDPIQLSVHALLRG